VVSTYPSEKYMSSSVGIIIQKIWKNVPNHQPEDNVLREASWGRVVSILARKQKSSII